MIVQCPACKALVEVGTVTLKTDTADADSPGERAAGLTCPACDVTTWLFENRPKSAAEDATVTMVHRPAQLPPKTDRASTDGALDVATIRGRIMELSDEDSESASAIADLFDDLLDDWYDDQKHSALLERAALAEALAMIGARYRIVVETHPDEQRAIAARERIMQRAMLTLSASRDADGESPRKAHLFKLVLWVVAGLLLAGSLAVFARTLLGQAP